MFSKKNPLYHIRDTKIKFVFFQMVCLFVCCVLCAMNGVFIRVLCIMCYEWCIYSYVVHYVL